MTRRSRCLALTLALSACSLDNEGTLGDGPNAEPPLDEDELDASFDDQPEGERELDARVRDAAVRDARTSPPPLDAMAMPLPTSDSGPPRFDDPVPDGGPAARDAGADGGRDAAPPVTCDLTGSWAARVDFEVSWPSVVLGTVVPVLEPGAGHVTVVSAVATDASRGTSVVTPCGTTVPDFEGTALTGAELYGGDIPLEAWDAPTMPTWSTVYATSCDGIGCAFRSAPMEFVLGARTATSGAPFPPAHGWAEQSDYYAVDDDSDGLPGLTMITRGPPQVGADGRTYAYPPVGLASFGRARKLLLALQMRLQLDGSLESCDSIVGAVAGGEVHANAVGCTGVVDGESVEQSCSPDITAFVDGNLPVWTVQSASFRMVRLPRGGGCYVARELLGL